MTTREFDPLRLDVAAFARDAAQLEGRWPLQGFERLNEVSVDDPSSSPPEQVAVVWSVRGERGASRGGEAQFRLYVNAVTRVSLKCQRCLNSLDVALRVERDFLFVQGEDAAAQLDAEIDDDVLAVTRALDLRELIEDEFLLALPLVPRHEVCPLPLPLVVDEPTDAGASRPFAALSALKRSDKPN